jgi:hypothetical protein
MTLTEFLLARIAEDEAPVSGEWFDGGDADPDFMWGPARIKATCAALRAVVELHRATLGSEVHKNGRWDAEAGVMIACRYWYCAVCDADRDYGFLGGPDEGCDTLRALASVWAGHPEFDPEWRL